MVGVCEEVGVGAGDMTCGVRVGGGEGHVTVVLKVITIVILCMINSTNEARIACGGTRSLVTGRRCVRTIRVLESVRSGGCGSARTLVALYGTRCDYDMNES